ncbi:hypothetical protein ASPCAL14012 [Aspergillus calidoustus]|uniref:Zn(2)-C6 fungal-type domain-containing protein n=1 Tax=Aspergillus calidoustus TaxID=454130 RepID=A0A0U5CJ21_ASPCI|nr:hypothetical protein ASPCAL14012 [Aspergillus calidoustus]
MNDGSDQDGRPRKVRKGTHSCRECRRRKVRCTFASSKDPICITCHRRGTKCASQGTVEGLDRHVEPEAAFDQSVGDITLASFDDSSFGGNSSYSASLHKTPNHLLTPVLSATPASAHVTVAESTALTTITQTLLRALPPRHDIEILLGKISKTSSLCYQSNFKSCGETPNELPTETIARSTLLDPESHPVLLARQMLLFASALQHLSPTAVFPGLSKHHHAIMEDLANSAIQMVTTIDTLLGTLEGLENIILEGLYHIDSGNMRRAWLTFRRAVMVAQLLGLHQPGHYRYKLINEHNDLDPVVMWKSIVSTERVCSLLLGLPTSTSTTASTDPDATKPDGIYDLATLSMRVTARILERNQAPIGERAQKLTREIDQELIHLTQQLPSSFWRPLSFSGLQVDSAAAFWESRRAWDQMTYYSLVNQLHLPYMLCSSDSPGVLYSRIACVNASREILNRQIAFKTFNPITTCSRMGDFIALIAGMTLILAHLVSHTQNATGNALVHQRFGDRATVEQALECMKSMSELHEDVLAARCVGMLRDLLAIEANAARGPKTGACGEDCFLMIKVPYLGAIRIGPEGVGPMTAAETEQHRGLHRGVTIGGIGSIEVKSPMNPDYRPGDLAANVPVTGDAAGQPAAAIPPALDAPLVDQALPGEYFTNDQMFPDAAAPLDDWVFQGVDSAFFDVLMRGVGDPQVNNTLV